MDTVLEVAIWAGDVETLDRLAPCRCCCSEHTFGPACPAWVWAGCRGYDTSGMTMHQEYEAWLAHYARFHGMTEDQFNGR